jgi:hypothetical protein
MVTGDKPGNGTAQYESKYICDLYEYFATTKKRKQKASFQKKKKKKESKVSRGFKGLRCAYIKIPNK